MLNLLAAALATPALGADSPPPITWIVGPKEARGNLTTAIADMGLEYDQCQARAELNADIYQTLSGTGLLGESEGLRNASVVMDALVKVDCVKSDSGAYHILEQEGETLVLHRVEPSTEMTTVRIPLKPHTESGHEPTCTALEAAFAKVDVELDSGLCATQAKLCDELRDVLDNVGAPLAAGPSVVTSRARDHVGECSLTQALQAYAEASTTGTVGIGAHAEAAVLLGELGWWSFAWVVANNITVDPTTHPIEWLLARSLRESSAMCAMSPTREVCAPSVLAAPRGTTRFQSAQGLLASLRRGLTRGELRDVAWTPSTPLHTKPFPFAALASLHEEYEDWPPTASPPLDELHGFRPFDSSSVCFRQACPDVDEHDVSRNRRASDCQGSFVMASV